MSKASPGIASGDPICSVSDHMGAMSAQHRPAEHAW